jgi:hypothetical protein
LVLFIIKGYFEWFLNAGTFNVLDTNGYNYTTDNFGGNFTAVLFAWSDGYHSSSVLGTSDTLVVSPVDSMEVLLHEHGFSEDGGTVVSGVWAFDWGTCAAGDVLVVVPVDREGRGLKFIEENLFCFCFHFNYLIHID